MVLSLTFKCLICFEYILVYGERRWSDFIFFLRVSVHCFQHHYIITCSCLLCQILIAHILLGLLLDSVLFHWSLWLFLFRYLAVLHLIPGTVSPLTLFFFNIAVAIRGLLWFHMHFWIIFSSCVKSGIGILIGIMLNL